VQIAGYHTSAPLVEKFIVESISVFASIVVISLVVPQEVVTGKVVKLIKE